MSAVQRRESISDHLPHSRTTMLLILHKLLPRSFFFSVIRKKFNMRIFVDYVWNARTVL